MGKIVLIAIVFLAGVIMTQAQNVTTAAPGMNVTTAAMDPNATTTVEPTTVVTEPATTAVAGTIQPLAIFVLACAFLGLLH